MYDEEWIAWGMVVLTGASAESGKPDPSQANSAGEFVELMRRLKQWAGLGYRRLERRAAAAGEALPRSTVTAALSRETLPRKDLVVAFARACGCTAEEIQAWDVARRRLAVAATRPGVLSPPGLCGPAQLPADLATFTGREPELEHLLNICSGVDQRVVISAIDGMAGVGKTKS